MENVSLIYREYKFLKNWQIIELILLFFLIFGTFGLTILLTGDGNTVYNFYSTYILPLLIILFSVKIIATIAFSKKKKWAFTFNYAESILILSLFGLIILLIFISGFFVDKFSLFSAQGVSSLIFPVFFTLLYWSITKKYIKIKKSGMFSILLAMVSMALAFAPQSLQAQDNKQIGELLLMDAAPSYKSAPFPYDFISTDIKDVFAPEKNGKYPSTNLFDGYFKTCWVAGSTKTRSYSALYIKLPVNIDPDKIILNIFSGYGKSKALYYQNSRPKRIKISLFSAFHPEGYSTETASLYIIKKIPFTRSIELSDTFGVQSFPLNLDKKTLFDFQKKVSTECKLFQIKDHKQFLGTGSPKKYTPSFILKIEITEAYPGTKYNDLCISEIFFNDRFITPYPERYNEVKNVYIKNDNTLVTDYANGKVDVIKDTSAVFTMADWPKNSNWAILHFVPNDEAEAGSRVEEHYSLIDLKHGKIVNAELEKCTGISPAFQTIEKAENGKIYINNDGKYKIELK